MENFDIQLAAAKVLVTFSSSMSGLPENTGVERGVRASEDRSAFTAAGLALHSA